MKKLAAIALAALAAAMTGCKSIEVDRKAQTIATVRDADGITQVVKDQSGNPIVLDGGWSVEYFQHWNWQEFDSMTAKAGQAELAINNYRGGADATNLTALVKTSFDGAALLAAKIGAAIASGGGSVAGDAAYQALHDTIAKYISKGGDVANAKITCENGNCTINDGTVSEVCESCFEK